MVEIEGLVMADAPATDASSCLCGVGDLVVINVAFKVRGDGLVLIVVL